MKKGFLDGYKRYDTTNGYGNAKMWKDAFYQRMKKQDAKKILKGGNDTPHGILGIGADASQTEIKQAFRKLITEWHPDKNQHRLDEAEEMSKKIIAAYSLLSD